MIKYITPDNASKRPQALTLDGGNHWHGGPVNQKIHWPPKKSTGLPKTCNDPNVFAAGIYDFTREVANFCTLGLYITKNKYELTLPSEFCRFPVKIMAAYEALKKNLVVARTGPTASKRHAGQRGHIANVKAWALQLWWQLFLDSIIIVLKLTASYVRHKITMTCIISHDDNWVTIERAAK